MQLALAGQDEKERKESTRSERLVHTDFADHPRTSCRSLILFFVYCNSAEQAVQETSTLKITNIPEELTVPVAYGIADGFHISVYKWCTSKRPNSRFCRT